MSASIAALCGIIALGGFPLMSAHADEPPNYDILRNAAVFGMCQEPRTEADIEALAGMGIDVIVRGISCAWHATPDGTRARMAAKKTLRDLARERGICFCTMITSAAIYADKQGADNLEAWASRDAKGQIIKTGSWNQGCLNDPEYRDYVKQIARAAIDGGADGIHYDEAYSRWFWMKPIPCFCDDCCRELREFIPKLLGPTGAEKLGIEDLDNFNYRDYLAANGYADAPHQSPLHDVWWEMQLDTTYRYEKEIVQDAKAYGMSEYGREIVVNSNPYGIATVSAVMTMESAVYDFINIGTGWRMSHREGGRWRGANMLPPRLSYVPEYKMARAHADGKPVAMFLDIQRVPEHIEELPAEQVDNLMQWLFAESYASGCFFAAHHRFSGYNGPVASQQRYGSFYKRHRNLFVDSSQLANIGVAYSYPSQIWDMYPLRWVEGSDAPAHAMQYYGACQAIQTANLQYETLFFGDGKLFPLSPSPEELDRYEVIILPCCYAMTDGGVEAIEGYLSRGGTLVVIGDFATRDEHRALRDPPPSLAGERVRRLDAEFEASLSGAHPDTTASLCTALVADIGITPMVDVASSSANAQVHCRLSADGNAYIVHLINQSFKPGEGFTPATDVTLELALPDGFSPDCACTLLGPDYSGGDPVAAKLRRIGPGRVAVTLPDLAVFRAVVIEK